MAGSLANYLEDEFLDHVLKTGAFPVPTNLYIALSTADPLDTGAGLAEPASNYARVNHNAWDAAASRASENTGSIAFVEATGSWGVITHWALMDASSGGNMLAHGDLAASKTINSGDTLSFAAGDIDITVTANGMSDFLADAFLDHVLKTTSYTQPSTIYIALATVAITDSMTGTTITEPASNYARKQQDAWDVSASGASENTDIVTFVEATASWGTIGWFALVDALTVGNLLFHAAVDTAKAVDSGDTAEFAIGALDITLD